MLLFVGHFLQTDRRSPYYNRPICGFPQQLDPNNAGFHPEPETNFSRNLYFGTKFEEKSFLRKSAARKETMVSPSQLVQLRP